jgi:glycosyltransferase involved in cell wall biosynthesis
MEVLLGKELSEEERRETRNKIAQKYNWDKIAEQTMAVYQKAIQ